MNGGKAGCFFFSFQASLPYTSGGEMKKASLGLPLIPPIRKAGSLPVDSAAGSLRSSPRLDFQESREMRPRSSSRTQDMISEHSGLTGYPLAKRFSLASPSMLLPSKPLLPIQRSSPAATLSKMFHREQETGKPGSSCEEEGQKKEELNSEGKGMRASLPYPSGGEMKKASLGLPLIPPIRKAGSLPVDSAAGSLRSSPQPDFQESREMRPRSSSRSQEKTLEHSASHRGLTGYPLAKRFSLASPSMLLPSKPLLPIQRSSPGAMLSKMFHGEQETGKPGSGCEEQGRKNEELMSEGKGMRTSLPYPSGGEMKKGSLGKSMIPVICKAGRPRVGSAAGSLRSSLLVDFQESREMRPRSSSRSQEKTLEREDVTGFSIAKSLPPTRPSSLLPTKPLPPIRESSSSIKPGKMDDGEKDKGQTTAGYKDIRRSSQEEQSAEGKGHKVRRPS
ncbi:uncharacterized protein LOC119699146 [Motacilla alba alba]|uniref:uncharacterized protein LOC119699146 n=1 Tax=Motacilla alba alba TaxID=1094192 RepID=UPI0018D5A746|nr:uncharacterized protein LOC119699146 [Motacilla alba alba]